MSHSTPTRKTGVVRMCGVGCGLLWALLGAACGAKDAAPKPAGEHKQPAVVRVQAQADANWRSFEATVQAVRHSTLAAQVPGAVVEVAVQAGAQVHAGQVLLRLDGRAASQAAAAAQAQYAAAAADAQRKRQLYASQYVSRAALDQANAAAQAAAAQAAAAQTQAAYHVVRAPYAGVVSAVRVELGDAVQPGHALVEIYDPGALRVQAQVPVSDLAAGGAVQARIELPDLASGPLDATHVEVLPTVDAASLTQAVRASLPRVDKAAPGMFARLWLPAAAPQAGKPQSAQTVYVPLAAVVRRAEMTGLYVLDAQGRALLRQVRLGRVNGDTVEVQAGLQAGEQVAADAQAVARPAQQGH